MKTCLNKWKIQIILKLLYIYYKKISLPFVPSFYSYENECERYLTLVFKNDIIYLNNFRLQF